MSVLETIAPCNADSYETLHKQGLLLPYYFYATTYGRNSICLYFFSQVPKCWLILFQYTNVYLSAKFCDLKPTINEKLCPQIWTCFWARRNKIHQGNCDFNSTKCFINVNWSSCSTDCAAENSKPPVMLWDQSEDQPSKNWENPNFWSDSAWIFAFSSQSHTMWS